MNTFDNRGIFLFCFMILVAAGYDIWAVHAGVISSYDDERWRLAIIIAGAFLLVFRPGLFRDLLEGALVKLGLKTPDSNT